jgi:hypothetical protein
MAAWHFRGLGLALVLAAPLQAPAQQRPVYLLLPGKDGEELVRVEGGKAGPPLPAGQGCIYGVSRGKLALVGTLEKKAVLQVYDPAAKKVTLRLELSSKPLRYTAGPAEQVLFSPAGDRLAFVCAEDKKEDAKDSPEFSVNIVDLRTRRVSRHPLAKELTNPCLTALPGAVGIYSVIGCQSLYSLPWEGGKAREVWADGAEKSFAVADLVGVPGVGVFRVGHDGKAFDRVLEEVGRELRKPKEKVGAARREEVCRPLGTTLDGKPVLVWGEQVAKPKEKVDSVPQEEASRPIRRLVVYGPAKGKTLWQKQLPFGAETYAVSPDCRFFYLIDREKPALVQYDRKDDRFKRILDIRARPIIHSVAVILIPES